jgi:ketopantoate reductase
MHGWATAVATLSMTAVLWSGSAHAQAKPACDAQGRVMTPQKVEARVIGMDAARSTVTVREANGTLHEFQASREMLQDLKVGDRIEANLREAPKCP